MERKLATVLFVDLVDSSALVSAADPEVVRRRVTRFFDRVSSCVQAHGGTVEKFAGDAVMAAFGVPRAHEDDAERALRAALAIMDAVRDLHLEARIGVDSGEVVTEDGDSTFATGPAVNRAARLQAAAEPNEILVGPSAHGLVRGAIELEPCGERELRGLGETVPVWRALCIADEPPTQSSAHVPLVGRDWELDLLENTYSRAVRDRRAHVMTIFGEPGVGKSRLTREFVSGLDSATVLSGRCLPYGEGITYWPLAEMVKSAAGITDDEPTDEAHEKLVASCEDEVVADLLALASGVLEAVEGERSQQEIAWAAREWAASLAAAQPLVLVFEDIHWAEEALLELIQHVAESVRDAPLLLVCLARPELLELSPGWGGGRLRATAIELEPLARDDSEALLDALLAERALPPRLRSALLEKTEGNPLFVEETVRMLSEDGDGRIPIPDTLQAIIAARIDRLEPADKLLLQRAAVIGRVFWRGALERLGVDDAEELPDRLGRLLAREFVLEEPHSTIRGEAAYRFKHVLIREVAYAGLPKADRADLHEAFAEWLDERAGEELVEIRAYHLDHAAQLVAELEGDVPEALRTRAARALDEAGKRALAREANRAARKLLLRAAELEPTLHRRHKAAVAAWRLDDLPAVAAEMEEVLRVAEEAGDHGIQGRALTALAQVALLRDADVPRAHELATDALEILPGDDHPSRFDAYSLLAQLAWWAGDVAQNEQQSTRLSSKPARPGARTSRARRRRPSRTSYLSVLDLPRAEEYVARACRLAEESATINARARGLGSRGALLSLQGDLDGAEEALEEARSLFEEAGAAWPHARTLMALAWLNWERGDTGRAEKRFRESIRILKPLEDRGALCESQRGLAQLLLATGRVEEAERLALESRKTVGPYDQASRATTRMALGLVRAAQGRCEEAESLLREALSVVQPTAFESVKLEVAGALSAFLESQGRDEDVAELERAFTPPEPIEWLSWTRRTAAGAIASGSAGDRAAPAPVG